MCHRKRFKALADEQHSCHLQGAWWACQVQAYRAPQPPFSEPGGSNSVHASRKDAGQTYMTSTSGIVMRGSTSPAGFAIGGPPCWSMLTSLASFSGWAALSQMSFGMSIPCLQSCLISSSASQRLRGRAGSLCHPLSLLYSTHRMQFLLVFWPIYKWSHPSLWHPCRWRPSNFHQNSVRHHRRLTLAFDEWLVYPMCYRSGLQNFVPYVVLPIPKCLDKISLGLGNKKMFSNSKCLGYLKSTWRTYPFRAGSWSPELLFWKHSCPAFHMP